VQETPETTLIAAQAYLLTTQPEPRDPREHMHQEAIKSLGFVEDRLRKYSLEKSQHITRIRERKAEKTSPRKAKQVTHQATKSVRRERMMQGIS
jgi:hypothetical protein